MKSRQLTKNLNLTVLTRVRNFIDRNHTFTVVTVNTTSKSPNQNLFIYNEQYFIIQLSFLRTTHTHQVDTIAILAMLIRNIMSKMSTIH
jgi:hypothetical protein